MWLLLPSRLAPRALIRQHCSASLRQGGVAKETHPGVDAPPVVRYVWVLSADDYLGGGVAYALDVGLTSCESIGCYAVALQVEVDGFC